MSKNQLIIGLGGVGGKSIAAFRKYAEILHEADYKYLIADGYKFEYLYIDSNDDIKGRKKDWEAYGRSIKLSHEDFIHLKQEGGFFGSMRSLVEIPNIEPWIGDFRDSYAKLKNEKDDERLDSAIRGITGAGQLRRFGRVLFAINSKTIYENLHNKIEHLVEGREANVDVRIFCTLGGGTGSGSIVDMVTLIQSLATAGHKYETYIYPFVAGKFRVSQDTGSFYQNEYAALRDLNGLMVEKYHPFIVTSGGQDESDNLFYGERPIKKIYLSSEESPGTPKLEEQVNHMTRACFDTIMYGDSYENSDCLKALTDEDKEHIKGEPLNNTRRSYSFAALGAKRLCVPTEQIKELLRADYAKRVLKSWLGGTLHDFPRDFDKIVIPFDFRTGRTMEEINRWIASVNVKLTDEYNRIRQGKRDDDILEAMRMKAEEVRDDAEKLMGNSDMEAQIAKSSEQDAAKILRSVQIEMDERMTWPHGGGEALGLEDVRDFIGWYKAKVYSWKTEFVGVYDPKEIEEIRTKLVDNMRKREEQWKKLAFMTIHLTEKDERMIENHYKDCLSLVNLALLKFRSYAVSGCIKETTKRMDEYGSLVDLAIKENKEQLSIIEQEIKDIEADLNDNSQSRSLCDQYEFDDENLKKVRDKINNMDKEHRSNMATVFKEKWENTIESLSKFLPNKTKELMDNINEQLYICSKELHDTATKGSLQGVLLTSIFERLLQIAGKSSGIENENWDKALDGIIERFFKTFPLSSFLSGGGKTSLQKQNAPLVKAFVIGFPEGNSDPKFVNWLKDKLKSSIPNEYRPLETHIDFYTHKTAGEIRMLYMPHWFPARFAPVIGSIYKSYKDSAKDREDEQRIYFANIDDEDIGLGSNNRPALTEEGDPDKDTARRVDLVARLKITLGGREFSVLSKSEKGIVILRGFNEDCMPQHTRTYSAEEQNYPSKGFTNDLNVSISLVNNMMDEAQKRAFVEQCKEDYFKERDKSERSEETKEAEEIYDKAKELFGL